MRAEKERPKLASLSRMFLYKAAECIYEMRCPQNLSDLEKDQAWFSLSIRKSSSLRSLLNSKSFYGWFKLDIILTNPDTVIERWHFINLTPKKDRNQEFGLKDNIEKILYRRMSQIMRSLYSALNTLPAKTLQLQLDLLPTNTRQIKAICDPFKQLPAKNEIFSEYETAQIRFGPIFSPVGRTVIFCNHRIDLDNEIPCPIRTAGHYDFSKAKEEEPLIEMSMEESYASKEYQTFGMSYDPNGSNVGEMFSNTPGSLGSFVADDFVTHVGNEPTDSAKEISLPELQTLIEESIERGFSDKESLSSIKSRFQTIKEITDNL